MLRQVQTSFCSDFSDWIKQCNYWKKHIPWFCQNTKMKNPVNSYYFTNKLSDLAKKTWSILHTGILFSRCLSDMEDKKRARDFWTTGGLSSMGWWVAGIGACMANDRELP